MSRHLWGNVGDDGEEVPLAGASARPSDKCLRCGLVRMVSKTPEGRTEPCRPSAKKGGA